MTPDVHKSKLIIVSRGSRLALWQAHFIKTQLEQLYPTLSCDIMTQNTIGDRIQDRALSDIGRDMGGKNLFVKELQQDLLNKTADIAVHSLKDLSTTDHPDLILAAVIKREDPRDVFISPTAENLSQLKPGAVVGTASPRRQCQLLALRRDITVKLCRGNVDTRLEKVARGEYDAIVLAAAGVKRLGREDAIRYYFDPHTFIPAIGQGALAVECRADDIATQQLLQPLDDPDTRYCVTAERAVNRALNGDCHTPIGAYATLLAAASPQATLHLSAMMGSLDGAELVRAQISGDPAEAENLGKQVALQLCKLF